MIINKDVLAALNPCESGFDNYLKHYRDFNGSIEEFHKLEHIPDEDKAWVYGPLKGSEEYPHLIWDLIQKRKADVEIAQYVLSQPQWEKNPEGANLLRVLIQNGTADYYIAKYALSQPQWEKNPEGANLLRALIQKGTVDYHISKYVLSQPHWRNNGDLRKLLNGKPLTVENIRIQMNKK